MKFRAYRDLLLREQIYEVDTMKQSTCVINRDCQNGTRFLMREALKQGCSVITYGKNIDFYQNISDLTPTYISVLEYETLMRQNCIPYIKGSCDKAIELIEECYRDYSFENKFRYLKRQERQQLNNPCINQSFYQIKRGNIAKEKVITESVLINIVAQALYRESLHELAIFLDMPFKPITRTMLETLDKAKEAANISIICLYYGRNTDGQPVVIDYNNKKMTVEARNRGFYIKDEEIY